MKSILMSIQPKLVAKILNGEKTIEIRKRFPKDYRGWVYIYCTKDRKDHLIQNYPIAGSEYLEWKVANSYFKYVSPNGYVVARFYCDNVEEIKLERVNDYSYNTFEYMTETLTENELLKLSCLREYELNNYLTDKSGYTIHISQLEIFDKPKELSDFFKVGVNKWYHEHAGTDMPYLEFWNTFDDFRITKAPQSWQYVEVEE